MNFNPRRLRDVALLRLRSIFGKRAVDRELQRELAFHLDQQTQENIDKGMPADQARFAAMRKLGGMAQVQEQCRDTRRVNQLETTWKDFSYAVRTLWRTPGFSVILVLTLALAIGANSAIFSVIEGVLLRPLPYSQPDRLVRIYFNSDSQPKFPLNPYDLRDFRDRSQTFESIAAISFTVAQLSGSGGDPLRLKAFAITAGYFHLLGLSPARGREFSKDDELAGRGRLAILSDRLWKEKFGSAPDIVGRTITINALPYTVVGVMPPGTQHPGNNFHSVADGENVDLWMPFTFDGDPTQRGSHYLDGFGRLKPGVTAAQANADLSSVLSQLQKENTGGGWRVYTVPLYQETVGRSRKMLLVLLGAVGLLLLIACVNAANLLLARSTARVREIAIRSALGAGRGRIARQVLTESLVIAFASAALGTVFAFGGVKLLVAGLPLGFPRASDIKLDAGVFAFTLVVAVLAGILFGLAPALMASRTDVQQGLRDGARGATGGRRQLRIRNLLVVGETALACVLLIGAGLMLHSFANILNADPGFRPRRVMTASVSLPPEQYNTDAKIIQFYDQLTSKLRSTPGVEAAGIGSDLPWTGYDGNVDGYTIEGRSAEYNRKTTARYHEASPDYFKTVGTPLLQGRFFTALNDIKAPTVIIVNQAMASRYWPGEDAVGKRISFHSHPAIDKDWIQIVGVVADVKDQPDSSSAATRPAMWFPFDQNPDQSACVAIRSSSDPGVVTGELREAVRQLDSGLAVGDVRTMNQVFDAAVSPHRFAVFLVGMFAVLALILASIGIYGVISYSVNQRRHEFGVRMALGANPWGLVRMIVFQGLRLSAAGAVAGLIVAAAIGRVMSGLLYGVNSKDPVTFGGVAALCIVTTIVACYLPARRARDADPMNSLRSE